MRNEEAAYVGTCECGGYGALLNKKYQEIYGKCHLTYEECIEITKNGDALQEKHRPPTTYKE